MANTPVPNRPLRSHPGELLAEVVLPALKAEQGVTKAVFARHLKLSRVALDNILKAKAPITPPTAVRLGKLLGNGPGLWLRMQASYDLDRAERALAGELEDIPSLNPPHADAA